jgi:hypothetical protein
MHVAQLSYSLLYGTVKKSSESIQRFWRSCAETKFCTDMTDFNVTLKKIELVHTLSYRYAKEAEYEKVVLVKVVVNHPTHLP